MPWETRDFATCPNDQVMAASRRLHGQRVRLTIDPRSFVQGEDDEIIRVEGTILACTNNGPTLLLQERDAFLGGRIPLIDILLIERQEA
jgi:hypothetical protein